MGTSISIGMSIGSDIVNALSVVSPSTTPLLDVYPGAAAAYSTRKMSTTYSGSAIRVRRSSDNAEQDIGFLSGQLNETSLTTFVGGGSGYVTIWYDQSGNGRNAVQATAASQPRIVNAGVVDKQNTKPSILFTQNLNQYLLISTSAQNFVGSNTINHTFGVFNQTATATATFIGSDNTTVQRYVILPYITANFYYDLGDASTAVGRLTAASRLFTNLSLVDYRRNGATMDSFRNGSSQGSKSNASSSFISTANTAIGARFIYPGTFDTYFGGYMSEIVIYPSDQSANRTGINTNINTQYNLYWQGNGQALLDINSGATVAYSVRALNSSYTGPILRVRRTSDNAELDIYANKNGDLDQTSITSFVGGGSGYVTIWYDQSGNGNNFVQATAGNQARIASAGTIDKLNLKPALYFDASLSNYYFTNATISVPSTISSFVTASLTRNHTSYSRLINGMNDLRYYIGTDVSENIVSGYGNGSVWSAITANSSTSWLNLQKLVTSLNNGTDSQWINGATITPRASAMTAFTNNISLGGVYTGATQFFDQMWQGYVQEYVMYTSYKSTERLGIETNTNSYYNIY